MLVLTRQKNQKVLVRVGDAVLELVIVDVKGDKVKLGFAGPDDFQIKREELVAQENRSAAKLAPEDLLPQVAGAART